MPEVQNIGAVDYSAIQPQQVQAQEQYPVIPVYDEQQFVPQRRGISVPATVIIGLITAGVGGWIGNKMGAKAAAGAIDELKAMKNSEAVKNYEEMKKAVEEINKEAGELIDTTFGGLRKGKEFAKNIKEKFKPFVKEAEKTADDAAKKGEEAAKDEAKSSAEAKRPTHS